VKPIPILFHIGPLTVHTYGVGLAVTVLFGFWYLARRFGAQGLDWRWVTEHGLWIIAAAVVGARLVHVIANITYYFSNPGEIVMVWHGGLSSFGGLLFGIPVGLYLARRHCPGLSVPRALDLATPVLVSAWAMGRLLGPQLMIRGGGHQTSAWYGLAYAGQVGKRIPVPVFQSVECLAIFGILLVVERRWSPRPDGALIALAAALWGLSRFFDEFFWLAVPRLWDAVEGVALALSVAGWIALAHMVRTNHSANSRPLTTISR
jgi:phosphatidylglycerol:prolipoprotein diacylglycerol transferase